MARRHGKATVPFGRTKGVQVRHLSDSDLSSLAGWMSDTPGVAEKFGYLFESVMAEMRYRGMNDELEVEAPQEPPNTQPQLPLVPVSTRPRRVYSLVEEPA